ncbi:MAG: bifunctional folylpolyglutamate synthase/dihydrofolate synthase, partial [Peptococcaceae bacterium]|nr:bifunctional folylpolyglutamate synthase/dihydrofolate synthase [Peptococcaceae bacterium]
YFREQQTDFTVLEVGLGGALDSTNVVQPLVSVITNVARDHVEQLGQRIAEIAGVKAGIIKSGAPAVTAAQDPQALRVLEKQAGCAGVRLWRVGEDVRWQVREQTEEGQSFDLYGIQEVFPALKMRLVGAHQFRNAAVAVTIGELLRMEYGVRIPTAAVYEALRDVQWPGRLELISLRPKILLDGAHNPDGAQALAEALRLYKRRRLRMCLGILADKEREKVLDILVPLADELIITRPNSERAGDWETVATYAGKFGKPVRAVADPQDAAQAGIAGLSPDDMLCVSGSLYMLADLRKALLHLTRQE